jgi:hypothetical protein
MHAAAQRDGTCTSDYHEVTKYKDSMNEIKQMNNES